MANVFPINFDLYVNAIQLDTCLDQRDLIKEWTKGTIDSDTALKFTTFMQDIHSLSANGFAKKIDLKHQFNVNSFLDVGGGSGCYRYLRIKKNLAFLTNISV